MSAHDAEHSVPVVLLPASIYDRRTDRGPSKGESDNKIDEYSIKSK
jgi:hypothetical protein